jgi:arabinofuranan 3-O-arabinosyltransferase
MLSRRDIRLHAVSLAVASWVVFAWLHAVSGALDRFGTLRGVDFLQFYAAGQIVAEGRGHELYDWDRFDARLPHLVEGAGDVLYLPVYPPQLALFFAPVATQPYLQALAIWTLLSAALYAAAVILVLRLFPGLRRYQVEVWALAVGFPPFVQLIAHGQVTALAILPLLWAFVAFRSGQLWLAGLAFALLAFKPQLGSFALAAIVLRPSASLIAGLFFGLLMQCLAILAVLGREVLFDYWDVLCRLMARPEGFEPKTWAMHGLRAALELLLGRGPLVIALWAAGVVMTLWLARRAWHAHASTEARFAVICFAGLVINPHIYVYDLVLMAVPLACLAAWLLDRGSPADVPVARMAYALVWLPLLGPVVEFTRVQPTPLVIIAVLWMMGRSRASTAAAPSSSGRPRSMGEQ